MNACFWFPSYEIVPSHNVEVGKFLNYIQIEVLARVLHSFVKLVYI